MKTALSKGNHYSKGNLFIEIHILFFSYFFLEFSTPDEAVNAVKAGHGYRLDKSHIFKVNFFSDFEK